MHHPSKRTSQTTAHHTVTQGSEHQCTVGKIEQELAKIQVVQLPQNA